MKVLLMFLFSLTLNVTVNAANQSNMPAKKLNLSSSKAAASREQVDYWWATQCYGDQQLINSFLESFNSSPLHFIASRLDCGDKVALETATDSEATKEAVNKVNSLGQTPLHIASMFGVRRSYVYLALAGADLNSADYDNKIAAFYAPQTEDGQWIKDFTAMIRCAMANGEKTQTVALRVCRNLSGDYDKPVKEFRAIYCTPDAHSSEYTGSLGSFSSLETASKQSHSRNNSDTEYGTVATYIEADIPTKEKIAAWNKSAVPKPGDIVALMNRLDLDEAESR